MGVELGNALKKIQYRVVKMRFLRGERNARLDGVEYREVYEFVNSNKKTEVVNCGGS